MRAHFFTINGLKFRICRRKMWYWVFMVVLCSKILIFFPCSIEGSEFSTLETFPELNYSGLLLWKQNTDNFTNRTLSFCNIFFRVFKGVTECLSSLGSFLPMIKKPLVASSNHLPNDNHSERNSDGYQNLLHIDFHKTAKNEPLAFAILFVFCCWLAARIIHDEIILLINMWRLRGF